MLLAEMNDIQIEEGRAKIAAIAKQIRSKESPTPPFIYGCIAAAIAWYFQAPQFGIVLCAVGAAVVSNLARSLDLSILETRLQGETTRLAILLHSGLRS